MRVPTLAPEARGQKRQHLEVGPSSPGLWDHASPPGNQPFENDPNPELLLPPAVPGPACPPYPGMRDFHASPGPEPLPVKQGYVGLGGRRTASRRGKKKKKPPQTHRNPPPPLTVCRVRQGSARKARPPPAPRFPGRLPAAARGAARWRPGEAPALR